MIESDHTNDKATSNESKELSESTSRSNLLSIINDSIISSPVLDNIESIETSLHHHSNSNHSTRRFLGGRPSNIIKERERGNASLIDSKGKGKEIIKVEVGEVITSIDSKAISNKVQKLKEKQSRNWMMNKRMNSNDSFLTNRSNKAKSFNSIQKFQGEGFDILGGDSRDFERRRKEKQQDLKEVTPIQTRPFISIPPDRDQTPIASSDEEPDEDIYYDAQSSFAKLSPMKSKSKPLRPAKSILRINNSYSSSPPSTPPPLESTNSFLTTSPLPLPPLPTTKTVKFSPNESSKISKSEPPTTSISILGGDDEPIAITEVLARPSDEAGMIIEPSPEPETETERKPKSEISRDEMMLVQVCWTSRQDLPDSYDENSSRKFPVQHRGRFEEFQVIYKRGRLELWSDRSSIMKPFRTSEKKLVHTLPLHPFRTKLSLYSSTDLIFSLHLLSTSSNSSTKKSSSLIQERSITNVLLSRTGTKVFIFRCKSITISKSWFWFLYLDLGGKLPRVLELNVPGIGVRINLPIPENLPEDSNVDDEGEDEKEGYKQLNSDRVLEACLNQLSSVGVNDWKELIESTKRDGTEIKLAWRRENFLDWVEDGDEEKDFSLISGFALRQPGLEPTLEIRPAIHYPTTVKLPPSQSSASRIISEPSSTEGFINRIKTNGIIERLYLSTNDGFLFVCKPSTAHLPVEPRIYADGEKEEVKIVLKPFSDSSIAVEKKLSWWNKFWGRFSGGTNKGIQSKRKEIISLNINSEGKEEDFKIKLEKEEKLRCRKQILDSRGYINLVGIKEIKLLEPLDKFELVNGIPEISKEQRIFLGTLSNGKELKFECNSRAVAKEWVNRLKDLSQYWERRYRIDAFEQMEFQTTTSQLFSARNEDERIEDGRSFDNTLSPLLSKLFNRCLTDDCRTIIHHGTFYIKRDSGIYVERHLFLLPSTVLEYNTKERDISGKPTTSLFHSRAAIIDLKNCYIYSGTLTESFFTKDKISGIDTIGTSSDGVGRIYSSDDGLISNDSEEDCTLVIFKKLKGNGKKGRSYVLRGRSRIERDVWVYALNSCINRLLREG